MGSELSFGSSKYSVFQRTSGSLFYFTSIISYAGMSIVFLKIINVPINQISCLRILFSGLFINGILSSLFFSWELIIFTIYLTSLTRRSQTLLGNALPLITLLLILNRNLIYAQLLILIILHGLKLIHLVQEKKNHRFVNEQY